MTLLPIHIIGGAIAIASGFVALYAAKGAWLHRQSGMLFLRWHGARFVAAFSDAIKT